ncbi:type II toxin-antitoxin system RelE/ParE family toxin [Citrobacter werkmanii]|nr:type II toxin-antitoxin system RelE/ParE family toxin [Citrobacter werkmanii]HEB0856626.1 type II toxin-antitoxin system RelE/ParE family toxin [Citrobacter freundii]
MIVNFRHEGLRDLFLHGRTSGVMAEHVRRLRHRLAVIDAASRVTDINMPGYRLHPLTGDRGGT